MNPTRVVDNLFVAPFGPLLTNERRRQLYDCIAKNPGIHVRKALRGADVPSGSGRYHLTQLVRAGLVVEHRHRNTVCLFPNDARLAESWQQLAALREPEYRLLYDWIAAHPEKAQNEIVAAFAASHGWKRGVTRKRVARLAADGIVRYREQGRYKIYSTAKPALVMATTLRPSLTVQAMT
jgi:predicted transcriptional regulator